jgi:hypothetical protein
MGTCEPTPSCGPGLLVPDPAPTHQPHNQQPKGPRRRPDPSTPLDTARPHGCGNAGLHGGNPSIADQDEAGGSSPPRPTIWPLTSGNAGPRSGPTRSGRPCRRRKTSCLFTASGCAPRQASPGRARSRRAAPLTVRLRRLSAAESSGPACREWSWWDRGGSLDHAGSSWPPRSPARPGGTAWGAGAATGRRWRVPRVWSLQFDLRVGVTHVTRRL